MDTNYSLADLKAVTGDNQLGGFGWLIILFLFLMGGGNFGFGGNNAQTQEILYGQQFDRIGNKLESISNGICDSTFALNNSILGEGRALQSAIESVKYDSAMNTQKVLDAICGNRIADMQNQINALQLQNAMCGVVRYPNAMTYNAGCFPTCTPYCPSI